MSMHQLTSLRETASFSVALLWILLTTAVATTTTPAAIPTTTTTSAATDDVDNDGGFCRTQFVSSANGSEGAGHTKVAMAAILELRRPQGRGCGAVSGMGLQVTAALIWAIRRLNGEGLGPGVGPFIPGLHIELRVYDDCSHDLLAARHIGELLSIHPDFNCTPLVPPLAGVLGTTTSQTTTRVARLLADTGIPHFGVSATLSLLSDNTTYPTFYRTVPSDLTQSKVLVDIVKYLNWTYVAGIYTSDSYGTEGFQEFKRLATKAGVCVFREKSFIHSEANIEDNMETFVRQLLIDIGSTRDESLGVVYFGHDREADILFHMIEVRRSKWHDQAKVDKLHWLFSDGVGTSLSVADKIKQYSSKHISLSSASSQLDDVLEFYFQALDNPQQLGPYWEALVREYLREKFQCLDTVSPVSSCGLRSKVERHDYVSAALDSLYSLAALLSDAHEKACGRASTGVCQMMLEKVNEGLLKLVQPQALNYTAVFSEERLPAEFVEKGRLLVPDEFRDFVPASSPLYFVNSAARGRWTKIGEYCNGSLTIQPNSGLSAVPPSECGTNCPKCRESDVIRFAYRPGDVIILGLYSISSPGSRFSCGDYRQQSSSVAAFLAFLHTVEAMTSATGSGSGASGRRFGALVLDDCYNRLTASALMSDLFSGKTTLKDPATGEAIDMSKVVAVVGSQSSSVTLSALSILTPLQVPTISYSATSPDLDDRNSFPYFLRPVPSDSLQARALVELVQKVNVTYVGAIYQDNNYGLRGINKFREMAEEVGICVESPVPVTLGESQVSLLQKLRNLGNKDAIVVVTFVLESTAIELLDAIRDAQLGLIFLASEAWGVTTSTLQGQRGMTARGSVVLTVDSSKEAGGIDMADYLKGLRGNSELPWMRDFWENELQCNLPGGFTNSHSSMCHDVRLSDAEARELATDQKVVQTVNSVASVIKALNDECRSQPNPSACMLNLRADVKTNLIKAVSLEDQKKVPFEPYLVDGNGNVGFAIHNVQKSVQRSDGTYTYVKVGTYDPSTGLDIEDDSLVFYNQLGQPITTITSSCMYKTQCDEVCGLGPKTTPTPPEVTTLPLAGEEGGSEGLVAAVVVLALLCVLLLLVLLLIVVCAKRRGKIPFLGVVKRNAGLVSWRPSRLPGLSMPDGEVNLGFSPTSPRTSLPLPPIPRSNTYDTHDQYNLPDDFSTSRLSISSGTSSQRQRTSPMPQAGMRGSSPRLGYPETSRASETGSQYDYSSDVSERGGRRPSTHQFYPSSQHRDMVQEQRRQEERLRQRAALHPATRMENMDSRDRPRAGSMPQVDRSGFLHLRGRADQRYPQGGGADGPHVMRPRSRSHDEAFRVRLGALSEDDQQLLMKHVLAARQQNQAQSPQGPRQQQSFLTSADVERPSQRHHLALSPIQSQTSLNDVSEPQTPHIVFQNPPPSCSSRMSLFSVPSEDPSLLYLHPIPSGDAAYLQVLPEPQHTSSAPQSTSDLPRENKIIRPSSLPTSLANRVNTRTLHPGSYAASPVLLANPRVTTLTSPRSPATSVFGSPASEGSEAVFISPGQEYPPSSVSGRTDVSKGVAYVSRTPQPSESSTGQTVSSPSAVRGADLASPSSAGEQNRTVLSPERLRRLIAKHNRSPHSSTGSEGTSPQTSPHNPVSVPGVVVRDSSGALFLVPQYALPLQQGAESGQPASSPVFFFPQTPQAAPDASLSPASPPSSLEAVPRNIPWSNSADFVASPTVSQNQRPTAEYQPEKLNDLSGHGGPNKYTVPYTGNIARTPRMGVDALSAQKRLADNGRLASARLPSEHSSDNSLETLNDDTLSNDRKLSNTSQGSTDESPASQISPGKAEASPSSLKAQQAIDRVDSIPYIQGYQLVPIPPPCRPTEHVENSSNSDNSNQTSGDSGNGEEIVSSDTIETSVPVMC